MTDFKNLQAVKELKQVPSAEATIIPTSKEDQKACSSVKFMMFF
jgi:hypothetical protein